MPEKKPSWHYLGLVTELGLVMVFSVLIGTSLGAWADARLGTNPFLLLVGLVLGIAAGGLAVYRTVSTVDGEATDEPSQKAKE